MRFVSPKGAKHSRDDITPSRKDAGAVLRVLNKEMQALIHTLTDTVAVLRAHVEEAAGVSDSGKL